MFKSRLAALTITTALTSVTVFAQEEYTRFKSEASVQALGSFVKQTTQNGVDQGATNSAGVLATYRYFFSRHHGVEANYSWTSNTQNYDRVGIDNNSHEISAAYVFRIPMKRWSVFALAGAGALVFDPQSLSVSPGGVISHGPIEPAGSGVVPTTQTRAAFVYGGGADINLTDHLFVRGEYRGFVYNSPTYDLTGLNGLDRVTHRAEPSIGFGWRF
ncbi:MAG TPA: outer membrane beta-barrel protein [Bryobacteraceae bacterium]|jgi:opacity protein-like surface antigen|nr:outer membrane beta-barrel protein [Bryobacteraceae bacterium]